MYKIDVRMGSRIKPIRSEAKTSNSSNHIAIAVPLTPVTAKGFQKRRKKGFLKFGFERSNTVFSFLTKQYLDKNLARHLPD